MHRWLGYFAVKSCRLDVKGSSNLLSRKRLSVRYGGVRGYQTYSEFEDWVKRVESTCLKPKGCVDLETPATKAKVAPFLLSIDPSLANSLAMKTIANAQPRTPESSFLEVTYPLELNRALRLAVSDLGEWSTFRLSKFYEAVDALTADVAYRHMGQYAREVTVVTAGHYNSRKLHRTFLNRDVIMRCYLTKTGNASMEVRTDAIQVNPKTGQEVLINMCHTIMVTVDKESLRVVKGFIPALEIVDEPDNFAKERLELANENDAIRRERARTSMDMRTKVSTPPSTKEIDELHEMHRKAIKIQEGPAPRDPTPILVSKLTFHSSFVTFPEQRNVNGKLFGGWVVAEALNLALYTAMVFAQGRVTSLGIDEAIFLQPISIGDLVTFTARLVFSTPTIMRVNVKVEVRDPADTARIPKRSNKLGFVFAAHVPPEGVLPQTYSEILMHFDAKRRHHVEGPKEDVALRLLAKANGEKKPPADDHHVDDLKRSV